MEGVIWRWIYCGSKKMKCVICGGGEFNYDNDIACRCIKCNILYNLKTKELDYSDGGGQDIPTIEKSKQRVQNAFKRFEIITPYKHTHNVFVDIGCGSGEMLEASKQFFDYHIGYDKNKVLIKHTQQKGLNTFNKYFESVDIENELGGVMLSINHVLEHTANPIDLLEDILDNLNKNDVIYIEVPLYTGYSFTTKKYNWSLWYDEHLALYSMETLEFIANKLDLKVLDKGYRNFITDNDNRALLLKNITKNFLSTLKGILSKKSYQLTLDNVLKDYGFIVLKK